MAKQGSRVDPQVYFVALGITVAFVLVGVLWTDELATTVGNMLGWIVNSFGWFFVLSTVAFLIFTGFVAVTRYGNIRLGKDDDRPEFRTVSWIAMMFSAGMGIGLMFYGVAEPISHLAAPPLGPGEAGHATRPRRTAMEYTYFHWALHPWAMYAVGRARDGLLLLSQGNAEPDQHGVPSAARRPRERADRQGDRHPRDLRDDVRQRDLARAWRAADQQRAELRLGREFVHDTRGGDHRGAHARVRRYRRCRAWEAVSSCSATSTWAWRSCCCCSS